MHMRSTGVSFFGTSTGLATQVAFFVSRMNLASSSLLTSSPMALRFGSEKWRNGCLMDVLLESYISGPERVDRLLLLRVLLPEPAKLRPPVELARAEEVVRREQLAQVRRLRVGEVRVAWLFRVLHVFHNTHKIRHIANINGCEIATHSTMIISYLLPKCALRKRGVAQRF